MQITSARSGMRTQTKNDHQKKALALSLVFFFVCGRPPVIHVFDGTMVRVNNRGPEPKKHPRRQL